MLLLCSLLHQDVRVCVSVTHRCVSQTWGGLTSVIDTGAQRAAFPGSPCTSLDVVLTPDIFDFS